MKTKTHNNIVSRTGFLFILLIVFITYSCSRNESSVILDTKIDQVSKSISLDNYLSAFDIYKNEIFDVIESLDDSSKQELFDNLNDDEFMLSFITDNELIEGNISLQNAIFSLEQDKNWISLTETDKITLFARNSNTGVFSIPRLKSGNENGSSECEEDFQRKLIWLNASTAAATILCACTVTPITLCVCYTAVMINHLARLDEITRERDACNNK